MAPFLFGIARAWSDPPPLQKGRSPLGPDHGLGKLRFAEPLRGGQTEQELSRTRFLQGGRTKQELSRTRFLHGGQTEQELTRTRLLQGGQTKQELSRTRLFPGRSDQVHCCAAWLRVRDRDCPCIVCNNIVQEARLKKQLHADYICSVPLFASRSLDRALSGTRESHLDYRETMKVVVTSVEA